MSEKRYFRVEYDEEWYLFDSTTISEQLVKEQAEYGYGVFANSLSPSEVVDLLNEQQVKIHRDEISIKTMMSNMEKLEKEIDEQQATIQSLQEQLQDYKKIKDNWDSMVAKATEVSLRNVELVEENGKLERQLRKAMVHLVSDTCSLSENRLGEVIEEIKNA